MAAVFGKGAVLVTYDVVGEPAVVENGDAKVSLRIANIVVEPYDPSPVQETQVSTKRGRPANSDGYVSVCTVCDWLAHAPQEQAEAMEGAMGDSRFTYTQIAGTTEMTEAGIDRRTISRHARGACAAGRKYR